MGRRYASVPCRAPRTGRPHRTALSPTSRVGYRRRRLPWCRYSFLHPQWPRSGRSPCVVWAKHRVLTSPSRQSRSPRDKLKWGRCCRQFSSCSSCSSCPSWFFRQHVLPLRWALAASCLGGERVFQLPLPPQFDHSDSGTVPSSNLIILGTSSPLGMNFIESEFTQWRVFF